MHINLKVQKFLELPFRGKVSPVGWFITCKTRHVSFFDCDCTNKWGSSRWSKMKAKNAKAKHRKRFSR